MSLRSLPVVGTPLRFWRRRRAVSALGVLAVCALLAGGLARAQHDGHDRRAAFMQHMINSRVDDALDAVQATPQQRQAVYVVRDRLAKDAQQTFAGAHDQHEQALEQGLALFTADRFDQAQAQALAEQHKATALASWQHMQASLLQGIADIHDILTPAQRQTLAEYLRTHRHGHRP